nr:DUF6498-containing protein [Nocardioides flavescens]
MASLARALAVGLGLTWLSRLARRLPGSGAWWVALAVLVVVNLLPVVAVLRGSVAVGDVLLLYWLENVVVWAVTIVRIGTARGAGEPAKLSVTVNGRAQRTSVLGAWGLAAFFAFHYGLFTLVHGVFTALLAWSSGVPGDLSPVLWLVAAIAASHLVSLVLVWFARGERRVVSPTEAMGAPYPRMLALHAAILGGFFLFLRDGPASGPVGGVAILCLVKLAIDVSFHLRQRRRTPLPQRGDGLYGPAAV